MPGTASRRIATVVTLGCLGLSTGCADAAPSDGQPLQLPSARPAPGPVDPADFVATVDNPFFPLVPGTRCLFQGTSDGHDQVVVVDVTHQRKRIQGVPTVVVRDTTSWGRQIVEVSHDWYAQDRHGNVWSFGEDTKKYDGGQVVSTAGSWRAGVDGAEPALVMTARPRIGDTYGQGSASGEAADVTEVVDVNGQTTVRFGGFKGVVTTAQQPSKTPDVIDHKLERKQYAPGVGVVLEVLVGGPDRLELVNVSRQ